MLSLSRMRADVYISKLPNKYSMLGLDLYISSFIIILDFFSASINPSALLAF